jgi:hypothetical protein
MEIRYASEEHMPVVVAVTLQDLADLKAFAELAMNAEGFERKYAASILAERLGSIRKEAMERALSAFTYDLGRDK